MSEGNGKISAGMPLGATLAAGALCLIFGANTVAIKISLNGPGQFTVAAIRFGMAGMVILMWALITGQPLKVPGGKRHHVAIITLTFFLQLTLFYTGLNHTLASRGALLANVQPFFVLCLAHFFIPGDLITMRKTVGILLGFSAVVVVLMDNGALGDSWQMGDVTVLLAALTWACNVIYIKRLLEHISPIQIVLCQTLFSAPLFMLAALAFQEPWGGFSSSVSAAILYQGLMATAFGFVAWNRLLQRHGAVALHAFIFLMPISGVALGGVILGEPISYRLVLALLLIVAGIMTVNARARRQRLMVHPGRHV